MTDLKPWSYSFAIENSQIIVPDADTLKNIIKKNLFFMWSRNIALPRHQD